MPKIADITSAASKAERRWSRGHRRQLLFCPWYRKETTGRNRSRPRDQSPDPVRSAVVVSSRDNPRRYAAAGTRPSGTDFDARGPVRPRGSGDIGDIASRTGPGLCETVKFCKKMLDVENQRVTLCATYL
jgi:hypothetical protein